MYCSAGPDTGMILFITAELGRLVLLPWHSATVLHSVHIDYSFDYHFMTVVVNRLVRRGSCSVV